jgi:hypothetical protein
MLCIMLFAKLCFLLILSHTQLAVFVLCTRRCLSSSPPSFPLHLSSCDGLFAGVSTLLHQVCVCVCVCACVCVCVCEHSLHTFLLLGKHIS